MYAFTENIMDNRLTPRPRNRGAFTLIELLVVIAIIAILAAILFPAFAAVRSQARQSSTMSNMHAVYIGAKLFNEDEGRYPSALFGYAETAAPNLALMTPPRPPQHPAMLNDLATPMDRVKEFFSVFTGTTQEGLNRGYLFPEQVKDFVTFTCPDNLVKDKQLTTTVVYPLNSPYNPGQTVVWEAPGVPDANGCTLTGDRDIPDSSYIGQPKVFYKMDSMDIGPALDTNGNILYNADKSVMYELHYSPNWSHYLGTNCEDKDPGNNGKNYLQQLKYKNPPGDSTVMIYNTDHVATSHTSKVLIMLMNGTVKKMDVVSAGTQLPMNYKQ